MIKILSAGLVGICMACFVLAGCGDKSQPDTKKEEVVRQKIPSTAAQPEKADQGSAEKTTAPAETEKNAAAAGKTGSAVEAAPDDQSAASAEEKPAEAGQAAEGTTKTSADEKKTAETPESESVREKETTAAAKSSAETQAADQEAALPETPQQDAAGDTAMEAEMDKVETDASEMAEADQTDPEQPAPVIDLEEEETPAKVGGEEAAENEKFFNPFAPLFKKEQAEALDLGDGGAREQRKVLTPLEKIGLGQLQLAGVIMAKSGNRAIVTDASGKGYVVRKGTYIGLNSGVVESIESDRIIVVEDLGGVTNKTVLKLQKPAGE